MNHKNAPSSQIRDGQSSPVKNGLRLAKPKARGEIRARIRERIRNELAEFDNFVSTSIATIIDGLREMLGGGDC